MRLTTLTLQPYRTPDREGLYIALGGEGIGEVAPYPGLSGERLFEVTLQLEAKRQAILETDWDPEDLEGGLSPLELYPSAHFGLESALIALLNPGPIPPVPESLLFRGSVAEIYAQVQRARRKGTRSAKIKVGALSLAEAREVLGSLKDDFLLRVDVNRFWEDAASLEFFSAFSLSDFDYVEEPLCTPKRLIEFPLPLAVDESFRRGLEVEDLEKIPNLKALVYKPMVHGGLGRARELALWAKGRGVAFVLSSTFETEVGLKAIKRLSVLLDVTEWPIGLGRAP